MTDAKVNFGASKITVYGEATIKELEKAGAFENLTIKPDSSRNNLQEPKKPFLLRYAPVIFSIFLIVCGYISHFQLGEEHLLTILFFAIAIVISGYPLFKTGLRNLLTLDFDMRTLMTIAVIGAALIGEWGEGAVVVILFAISEALEAFSMDKARNSIRSLMDLAPQKAIVRRDGVDIELDVQDVQIGDLLIVKPGQKIAMDGIVQNGHSAVNQAAITGESVPVLKEKNDDVFAGTLNEEGYLEVEVTKSVEDTTLAKIIHLVEEAQGERAPSQAFVDRFAKYYTPIIIGIAFLVAVLPPLLLNGDWNTWVYQGLAVLVVGCPCALVISTPVAVVTAIGTAARQGVLIKGGIYLEELADINTIFFDKTGTLTKGTPVVTNVKWLTDNEINTHLARMRTLETFSQHPLAKAIITYAEQKGATTTIKAVDQFTSITGKGIQANFEGVYYWIGNVKLAEELLNTSLFNEIKKIVDDWQSQGNTVMLYGNEEQILAIVSVRDEPRAESKSTVNQLSQLGLRETIMLTGDNEKTAQAISKEIGIQTTKANLLPEDKLTYIKEYKSKYGKVAMVGDGINDAPALAASNIGIAMGGAGTDTALETADIALMGDDLQKLPFAIKLSKKALRIIKQNITFSIVVKVIALLLVVPNWLTLWIAIFADMGATLLVTLNGLRLLKKE
ncbi:Cd2+/Zn2+-exporting ATPase [Salirhabdus euzebyi]|uniref:Cd(2+)-exporting ATPase n=1 Tax=Salirhabdus euzebyi TaxID=394506 RepID=A0A841Q6W2_9BACI|nr:Cd2+/Zn2+-exporting ATPase [Salirhabdus euzebyi]